MEQPKETNKPKQHLVVLNMAPVDGGHIIKIKGEMQTFCNGCLCKLNLKDFYMYGIRFKFYCRRCAEDPHIYNRNYRKVQTDV